MKWVLVCLFSVASFFGVESCLQQRFSKEAEGHYIVAEAGKIVTILNIRSVTERSLILEEISVPLEKIKKRPASWAEWVKNKAPGHSSWSMIEIDLASGEVLQCYSFSKAAQIRLSKKESLFATLLHLPLKKVSTEKQRHIGPPPETGESDFRKLWKPPFVFEGKEEEHPTFDVVETVWPQDGSELSGKTITLYLDRGGKIALPLWIQVETAHAIGNLHAIDSGRQLPSPLRMIARVR